MRLYTYRVPSIGDVVTSPGSRTENLFVPCFNGSEIVLKKSGTVDVQDKINSYAPYCDIRYMLNQIKVGDSTVLSARAPMYGDFSAMPAHPVDALNLISDVERRFNSLSDDVKASCNNDWRVYFARMFAPSGNDTTVVSDNVQTADTTTTTDREV